MSLEALWSRAIREAARSLGWPPLPEGDLVEPPGDLAHGDGTSNVALRVARELKQPPRKLAEALAAALGAEVAGPGFVNFRADRAVLESLVRDILAEGAQFGRGVVGDNQRVLIEFCSANPTGPLTIAHARQAVVGDVLARCFEFTGHDVRREYYVNDTGNQVRKLGESLLSRTPGSTVPFPEDGYHGDYIRELAAQIRDAQGDRFLAMDPETAKAELGRLGASILLDEIKKDLERFRVRFDTWTSQEQLEADGHSKRLLDEWRREGRLRDEDGAVWWGDKVLVKSDGTLTYRTTDIAYHRDKFARGFERVIDLWGPDHHAHVAGMTDALRVFGHEAFNVLIVQHCRLMRGTEEVKMSKRAGTFATLEELMDEVGVDAARYFFAMRKPESHMDFDLELAKRQTKDNPVFYSQYAAVRVAGILRNAPADDAAPAPLGEPEVELARRLRLFERTVRKSVERLDPSLLHQFLTDVAGAWQRYYEQVKVICDDPAERRMRLDVARAVRQVVTNALGLLGVSTPERM